MDVRLVVGMVLLLAASGDTPAAGAGPVPEGTLVRHGTLHEAIGQQHHEGRVSLGEIVERPHFYGVGALEGLRGEVTILDGRVTLTAVGSDGRLQTSGGPAADARATLLAGAYVSSWSEHAVAGDVGAVEFDDYVAAAARRAGIDTGTPFVFTVEGPLTDAKWHVLNGACPIHARVKDVEIPADRQPFQSEMPAATGTLVGIFAQNAAGQLTHPATSTHVHLLIVDPATGQRQTGHVERVGLRAGSVLRLPRRLPE